MRAAPNAAAVAAAAALPPNAASQHNARPLSLPCPAAREVLSASGGCSSVIVELDGSPPQETTACADGSSGSASFAVPLFLGAPTTPGAAPHGRLGRVVVTQPVAAGGPAVRRWERLFSASGALTHVSVDLSEPAAAAPGKAAPEQAAKLPSAAPAAAPPTVVCRCPRRCCTELEEAGGEQSLPTFLALRDPAPTCPQPASDSSAAAPLVPPSPQPTAASALLVQGLALACGVQALLLCWVLAARRATAASAAAQHGVGTAASAAEEVVAPEPPARLRPSVRDACTSPLALLAGLSPFARSKARQAAPPGALEPISEEAPEQGRAWAAAPLGVSNACASAGVMPSSTVGLGSLAPPPAGWTRWVGAERCLGMGSSTRRGWDPRQL